MLKRAVLAGMMLAFFLSGPGSLALAHADFLRSDPPPDTVLARPPARVTVWFAEAVEPAFSQVRVLDARGKQVDNGDSAPYQNDPATVSVTLPGLTDGAYTVAWQNVSTDGHQSSGKFQFYVGVTAAGRLPAVNAPLLQSPLEPVLHWIELLSILAIVGSLVFELLITRPVVGANSGSQAFQRMGRQMGFRTFKLIWIGGGAFLGASLAELAVKAAVAHGIPFYLAVGSHSLSFLPETGWGHIWIWRIGFLAAMFVSVAVAYVRQGGGNVPAWRDWRAIGLVPAAGVLLTLSLVSHGAAAAGVRAAAVSSDYVHLLAASVWVGGIVYLAWVAPPAMKFFRHHGGPSVGPFCPSSHRLAFNRFAAVAIVSVGSLVITGLYGSWLQVNIVQALATPYGLTLLVKLALVAALMALGAINFFWVRPRLASDAGALRALHVNVAAQAGLALVVVLSVGMLVSLEPARQAAARLGITPAPGAPAALPPVAGYWLWTGEILLIGALVVSVRRTARSG